MTFLLIEGFETIGTDATADSDVIDACVQRFNASASGTSSDPTLTLIDNYDGSGGHALRLLVQAVASAKSFRLLLQSEISNTASMPVIVAGFRYHNAESHDATSTLWRNMISTVSLGNAELSVATNCEDLIWEDSTSTQTFTGAITPGAWHYIEIEARLTSGSRSGYVKLYVDGVEIYDSGTQNIESTSFDFYGILLAAREGYTGTDDDYPAFDDVYVIEVDGSIHTGPLGSVVIERHAVTADTAQKDWSPSVGTDNFALVDEITVDDTDYVESNATGNIDEYEMTDSISGRGDPLGLVVEAEGLETTANGNILHVGVNDGTTADETNHAVDTISTVMRHYLSDNPSSGAALTAADLDTMKARIRHEEV